MKVLIVLTLLITASSAYAANCTTAGTRKAELWPFDRNSPWNLPVVKNIATTKISSTGFTLSGGGWINTTEWTHPVFIASSTDANKKVYCRHLVPNTSIPVTCSDLSQPCVEMKMPSSATSDTMADGHMHVIDENKKYVLETFDARKRADGNFNAEDCVINNIKDMGVYSDWHGTRAYGGSAIAGLIRKGEIKNGINHALAVAVMRKAMNRYQVIAGKKVLKGHIWPASYADGGYETTYGTTGNLYMGSMLVIPQTVNITTLGLSAEGLKIAKALQNYGAYIVDASGDNLTFYSEPAASTEITDAVQNQLSKIIPKLQLVKINTATQPAGGALTSDRVTCFAPNF